MKDNDSGMSGAGIAEVAGGSVRLQGIGQVREVAGSVTPPRMCRCGMLAMYST